VVPNSMEFGVKSLQTAVAILAEISEEETVKNSKFFNNVMKVFNLQHSVLVHQFMHQIVQNQN